MDLHNIRFDTLLLSELQCTTDFISRRHYNNYNITLTVTLKMY